MVYSCRPNLCSEGYLPSIQGVTKLNPTYGLVINFALIDSGSFSVGFDELNNPVTDLKSIGITLSRDNTHYTMVVGSSMQVVQVKCQICESECQFCANYQFKQKVPNSNLFNCYKECQPGYQINSIDQQLCEPIPSTSLGVAISSETVKNNIQSSLINLSLQS